MYEGMDESIVKSYYKRQKLQLDKELMNVSLPLFSITKCNIDDSKNLILIRVKNSYRSLHRLVESKLIWVVNCSLQRIEN